MRKIINTVIICLSLSTAAYGGEWNEVFSSTDGAKYFTAVDAVSFNTDTGIASGWFKIVDSKYRTQIILLSVDCVSGKLTLYDYGPVYSSNGNDRFIPPTKNSPEAPTGSILENIKTTFCKIIAERKIQAKK